MIIYEVEYEPGVEAPHLCKEVVLADGSKVCTHIKKENDNEIDHFTNEQIMQHVDNLLAYVSELSAGLARYPDEEIGFHPWPVVNFNEVQLALQEAMSWWELAYYRNVDGHSHDPATGEEVPN